MEMIEIVAREGNESATVPHNKRAFHSRQRSHLSSPFLPLSFSQPRLPPHRHRPSPSSKMARKMCGYRPSDVVLPYPGGRIKEESLLYEQEQQIRALYPLHLFPLTVSHSSLPDLVTMSGLVRGDRRGRRSLKRI
jgi:hypothetical protein